MDPERLHKQTDRGPGNNDNPSSANQRELFRLHSAGKHKESQELEAEDIKDHVLEIPMIQSGVLTSKFKNCVLPRSKFSIRCASVYLSRLISGHDWGEDITPGRGHIFQPHILRLNNLGKHE